jgi:hypothetical protein
MGLSMIGSSSSHDRCECKPEYTCYTHSKESTKEPEITLPNPNPKNWKLLKSEQRGPNLLVKLCYPDCINYEGTKILLFKNVTVKDLYKQEVVDPHFSSNEKFHSPIARFEPTDDGWNYGIEMLSFLFP